MDIIDTLSARAIDSTTAIALGYFDGVHLGHRAVISSAQSRKQAGLSTCVFSFAVTTHNPKSGKGRLNIATDTLKHELMRRLGVDYYIVPDFSELMGLSAPDFVNLLITHFGVREVYCGANFRFGKGASGDAVLLRELCQRQGAQVFLVPDVLLDGQPVSSSRIRLLLGQGDVKKAGELLGRPYSFDFVVTQGRRLGRSIGAPTINQYFEPHLLVPRYGVYASYVCIGGKRLPAVTNIGVRPTVDTQSPPLSETCILDFDGDLYGKRVEVHLVRYLRPEQRFDSVDKLKIAVEQDIQSVRKHFDEWVSEFSLISTNNELPC